MKTFRPLKGGGGGEGGEEGGRGGDNCYPVLRGSKRFWTSKFPFCSSSPRDQ